MITTFTDFQTGRKYSFSDVQLSELGPFEPDEAMKTFGSVDLLKNVEGVWKIKFLDGLIYTAVGTVKEYDQFVVLLVRRKR